MSKRRRIGNDKSASVYESSPLGRETGYSDECLQSLVFGNFAARHWAEAGQVTDNPVLRALVRKAD
jgi:hypothetical protein